MQSCTHPKCYNFLPFSHRLVFCSVELAESSCSHLFRHASEITRETKGGYLMGRIKVPEFLAKGGSGYIRLCLAPSEVDEENNAFHLHPNLLHINMRTNKKTRKVPVSECITAEDHIVLHNTYQD